MKLRKETIITMICMFIVGKTTAQIPTDNPYRTRYHIEHWSDSLPWKRVINATLTKGLIDMHGKVDSLQLDNTLKEISLVGGVLYFPAGIYYFASDLKLYDGVIIRGANPSITDAKHSDYSPATKFVFPKYAYSDQGNGTPNSSAFKRIFVGDNQTSNSGIVNVDVNRAMINFSTGECDNIFVYGVRSNNAATVSRQPMVGEKRAWQRLPGGEENIDITTLRNALVANCRINDAITDDFDMPNFTTNDGDVLTIKFEYGNHSGIKMVEKNIDEINKIEILDCYIASGKKNKIYMIGTHIITRGNEKIDLPIQDLTDWQHIYSKPFQNLVQQSFEKRIFFNDKGDSLHYRLLMPKNYDNKKKYPLVLFFHGIDQTGLQNNPVSHFVHIFVQPDMYNNKPCFVLVPHLDTDQKWYYNTEIKSKTSYISIQNCVDLVKKVKMEFSINEDNMYIAGLSSGGGPASMILADYPGLFNKVILMSTLLPLSKDLIKKLRNIDFTITAGKFDPIIPIPYTRLFVNRLQEGKVKVKYYEYDTGHLSWLNVVEDPRFIKSLFEN